MNERGHHQRLKTHTSADFIAMFKNSDKIVDTWLTESSTAASLNKPRLTATDSYQCAIQSVMK